MIGSKIFLRDYVENIPAKLGTVDTNLRLMVGNEDIKIGCFRAINMLILFESNLIVSDKMYLLILLVLLYRATKHQVHVLLFVQFVVYVSCVNF